MTRELLGPAQFAMNFNNKDIPIENLGNIIKLTQIAEDGTLA